MNVLCGWMAFLIFICAIVYFIQRDNAEYLVEFVLGAMFVIAIWVAITI